MKRKVLSTPQMVILLDVLFVYLFILILNSSKENIQVILPHDKVFNKGKILLFENNQYYEYKFDTKELIVFNFLKNEKFHKFIECKQQQECVEAKKKFGENKDFFILLPSSLFDEISKISMIAFGIKSCNKLKFYITPKGLINKEKLFKNKCLNNIQGFKENY